MQCVLKFLRVFYFLHLVVKFFVSDVYGVRGFYFVTDEIICFRCVWCERLFFFLFGRFIFSFFTVCFILTSIIELAFFSESHDFWFRSIMFFHFSSSWWDEMMAHFPDRLLRIGPSICPIYFFLCSGWCSDFKVWLFWFCDRLLIKFRDDTEGASDGTFPKLYF